MRTQLISRGSCRDRNFGGNWKRLRGSVYHDEIGKEYTFPSLCEIRKKAIPIQELLSDFEPRVFCKKQKKHFSLFIAMQILSDIIAENFENHQ